MNIIKKVLIGLIFIPLFSIGQSINLNSQKERILTFSNRALTYNTLDNGDVLKLVPSKILTSNLTYNSSGLTVSYASANRVKLSGTTNIVAGNSIRFGSPTTGTIYQIQSISTDTLTLDQTFTGSVSDEFYWGGIGSFLDQSGVGNNVSQSTASKQPKLLWAGTQQAGVYFNGTAPYFTSSSVNLGTVNTIFYKVKFANFTTLNTLLSTSTASYTNFGSTYMNYRINNVSNFCAGTINTGTTYSIVITRNGQDLKMYVDGILSVSVTIAVANNVDFIYTVLGARGGTLDLFMSGYMYKTQAWTRVLTAYEIQLL